MSWSVSAGGVRDEAMRVMREQLKQQNGLRAEEAARRDKVIETIEQFADTVPADKVLSISAWGSESIRYSYDDAAYTPVEITQIQGQYNVAVSNAPAAG